MNRRELLQLFGVGATILPIAAGGEILPAVARIIEPPKLELVEVAAVQPNGMIAACNSFFTIPPELLGVTVFCRSLKTGDSWRIDCNAYQSRFTPFAGLKGQPIMYDCTFECTGPIAITGMKK